MFMRLSQSPFSSLAIDLVNSEDILIRLPSLTSHSTTHSKIIVLLLFNS